VNPGKLLRGLFAGEGGGVHPKHFHDPTVFTKFWATKQAAVALIAVWLAAGCAVSHLSGDPGLIWAPPAEISYGTALSVAQLSAAANAPGHFAYNPPFGTVLSAGYHTLSVSFTPADATQYQPASATVSIVVKKATPNIAWGAPAPISYGTPISAMQLNANTSAVEGTFTYSPGSGSVLPAGFQAIAATFTPTDSANFQSTTATATLTVNKATPIVYWPNPAPIAYGTPLNAMHLDAISGSVTGIFSYSPPAPFPTSARRPWLPLIPQRTCMITWL
jgi:hypothetical protein